MRQKIILTSLVLSVNLFTFFGQSLENDRYISTSKFSVDLSSDVEYEIGFVDLILGLENEAIYVDNSLKFDIYRPANDTFSNKPAVICIHGGGFITGSKNSNDIELFCDSLAKSGYFAVAMEYRKGINITDPKSPERAMYRALQDSRSAVRYLRANAALYGIDPNHIYLVGQSAGAITALNNIYLDQDEVGEEIKSYNWAFIPTPHLGSIDTGTNLSFNGRANACVALWGAVQHDSIINTGDTTPMLLVHGKDDAIVPYDIGKPFSGVGFTINDVHGSKRIHERLDSLGINHETYFVDGEGHEFYGGVTNGNLGFTPNEYWDTIYAKTKAFLYKQHKPTASFNFYPNGALINFVDQSAKAVAWHWNFGNGWTSNQQNPSYAFGSPGYYPVKLTVQSEHLSWDTITMTVPFGVSGIHELDQQKINATLTQNQLTIFTSHKDQFELIQLNGSSIGSYQTLVGYNNFDLTNLAKGIYILTNKNRSFQKKIAIL